MIFGRNYLQGYKATHTHTYIQRDTHTDRDTQTHRHTDTHRHTITLYIYIYISIYDNHLCHLGGSCSDNPITTMSRDDKNSGCTIANYLEILMGKYESGNMNVESLEFLPILVMCRLREHRMICLQ